MLISKSHNFMFVHIWKTGGTSIRSALTRFCITDLFTFHPMLSEIIPCVRDHERFFRFAFVRNPWDLQVSLYHFILQYEIRTAGQLGPHPYRAQVDALGSFDAYIHWAVGEGAVLEGRRNQVEFLRDLKGDLGVNFVGRFERLQEDFGQVCEMVGLQPIRLDHKFKTERRRYQEYYTLETRQIVGDRFAEDCRAFDYNFEGAAVVIQPAGKTISAAVQEP
jgi:hypothetical protein